MHVITLEGGPVNSLADLKGKRVGMGQPGGVSMLDADAMMEQLGLTPGTDFKDFRVKLGNMANMLADGNLDAALWNGSFPLPPVIFRKNIHHIFAFQFQLAPIKGLTQQRQAMVWGMHW